MKRIAATLVLFMIIAVWVQSMQSMRQEASPAQQDLPGLEFLGEGPATYDIGPSKNFIVKRSPYRFEPEPGPTYTAVNDERVWSISAFNDAPTALWDDWVELGDKPAGCVIEYVGIDDDKDDRINQFFLDGNVIETVKQGMVFSGSFVVPKDGNLRFFAADSVGGWITPCVDILTPTDEPTETPTETPSPTVTNTATPTDEPTETPTEGPSPTPTDGPSPTPITETPIPTITLIPPTFTPTQSPPTPTIEGTPEPTKKPRLNSCVRINFDVGGDEARRGEYVVQEIGGQFYASWYADDGWKDSGWFEDIDIVFEDVYVVVLYYSGPDRDPINMKILNPAPDTPYGWMTRGICHAVEVAWPDEPPPEDTSADGASTSSTSDSKPAFVAVEEPAEEEESGSIYASLGGG